MVSKRDLIEVTFSITNKCNLKCPWCFENSSLTAKNSLSTRNINLAFQKLKGLKAINLTGGEIFVHRDIEKILSTAVKIFPHVHLITNGVLIPRSLVHFFKVHNISFGISVDGLKIIHEKIRGKNTFNRTINNIKLLRENGLYVNIQATISKLNIPYINDLISLGEKLRVNRVSFIRLKAIGRGKRYANLFLSSSETKALNEKIVKIKKQHKNINIMLKDSFFNTLDTSLVRKTKKLGPKYVCGGCRAGMEILHIEYNGDIYPCPYLQLPLGNILKDNIFDIWVNHPILKNLRSKERYTKCSRCIYWGICRGCRAESLRTSGNYLSPDPQCWR